MRVPEQEVGIARGLAKRLLPVALGISLIISLIFPVAYYTLQLDDLDHEAGIYAQNLAHQLESVLSGSPALWKYQTARYHQILDEFIPEKGLAVIRVLDGAGRPIPEYTHTVEPLNRWGPFRPYVRTASVLVQRELVGIVEIGVSQGSLLKQSLFVFLGCTLVGIGLATVAYRVPVTVVTRLEGRLTESVVAVKRANTQLAALVKANQVLTASLDMTETLRTILHEAALLSGAPMVRLLLLEEEGTVLRSRVSEGLPLDVTAELVIPIGESFSGRVAATGEPLAVTDTRGDSRELYPDTVRYGRVSYLGLPVKKGEQLFGVLAFNTNAPRTYSMEEIELLSTFATQAAFAIENARLHEAAMHRSAELGALLRANEAMGSSLDLDQVLQAIAQQAAAISTAPTVRLFLLEADAQLLRCRVAVGFPLAEEPALVIPVGASLSGQVAATGEPLAVPDTRADPRTHFPAHVTMYGVVSYLGLPVKLRDQLFGVLVFNTPAPRAYPQGEITFLTAFAQQAALAIQNARLYEQIAHHAKTLEATVRERTQDLRIALQAAEAASRAKSDFLMNISHELRTPLNGIIGFSDLLCRSGQGLPRDKQERFLGNIQASGQRLLELVNQVLAYTEAETGNLTLQRRPVSPAAALEEALAQIRPMTAKKAQSLAVEITPDLPPVVADPERLTQVCFNLLTNAVKFTPPGGTVRVTARRICDCQLPICDLTSGNSDPQSQVANPTSQRGDFLEIAVADTGIGITPEDLPRLFTEFTQLEAAATKHHAGTGIGLALSKRLVELHGGTITASSPGEGKGSTFTIRLPFGGPDGKSEE